MFGHIGQQTYNIKIDNMRGSIFKFDQILENE